MAKEYNIVDVPGYSYWTPGVYYDWANDKFVNEADLPGQDPPAGDQDPPGNDD